MWVLVGPVGSSALQARDPGLDVVRGAGERVAQHDGTVLGDEHVVFNAHPDAAVLLGHEQICGLEVDARFDRDDHPRLQGALAVVLA